jgi:hypothetical protein
VTISLDVLLPVVHPNDLVLRGNDTNGMGIADTWIMLSHHLRKRLPVPRDLVGPRLEVRGNVWLTSQRVSAT